LFPWSTDSLTVVRVIKK